MKLKDIPQFTKSPAYSIDVSWDYLQDHLDRYRDRYNLDCDPDFQRGYVWTEGQKENYVEFCLRGGLSSRDIYFNYPGWGDFSIDGIMVLVDGKQRLDAVLGFINNKVRAFGLLYSEFEDELTMKGPTFHFHINDLLGRRDILQWYLDLNSGGTVHTNDELDKVRDLMETEQA